MIEGEIFKLLLLTGIGVVAGFVNVMAGGGSTLTLPALIFLGLEGSMANGTNRIAILIQNVFAVLGFHQEKESYFKQSLKFSFMTLPGVVIGALVAVRISDELFRHILSLVIILVIVSLLLPRPSEQGGQTKPASFWLYLSLFGIGFYGGFIQAGVGFLLMAALFHLGRFNLIQVNTHKVFIVLVYMIPALFIFAISGKVNWVYGLFLAVGNAAGGWFAARISVRKGEGLVKAVLIVALFIMAYKLIAA